MIRVIERIAEAEVERGKEKAPFLFDIRNREEASHVDLDSWPSTSVRLVLKPNVIIPNCEGGTIYYSIASPPAAHKTDTF